MIIDDQHRIAFVHIPKCAGTTIREYLQPYDGLNGAHTDRVDVHPKLGMLDYVHIPLFTLDEHFQEELRLIQEYQSFAVIRDPYKRFSSSISQRLKMYGKKSVKDLTARDMADEIEACIEYLVSHADPKTLLPPEYIHFQRQVDYIYLKSEKLVESIYTTAQTGGLVEELLRRTGSEVSPEAARERKENNKTLMYRNGLYRFLISVARPGKALFDDFIPDKTKKFIKEMVYTDRDRKMGHLFEDDLVKTFIKSYYHDDIELYEKIAGSK